MSVTTSDGGGGSVSPYIPPPALEDFASEDMELPSNVEMVADHVFAALGLKQDISREYLIRALRCAGLFDKKQHDYGPDNIAQFGDLGVLIRLNDKIQRLKTLMLSGEQPEFSEEAFEDTWMDIHVYGLIGLMCMDGSWPKAYRHMER